MTARVCNDCGRITQATRCTTCQRTHDNTRNAARRDNGHTSPEWQRTSRKLRAEWVATHGYWCPGDANHGHHPSHDLTVHHPTPLIRGGSLTDQALRIVCRSANSSMGARPSVYRDGTDALD